MAAAIYPTRLMALHSVSARRFSPKATAQALSSSRRPFEENVAGDQRLQRKKQRQGPDSGLIALPGADEQWMLTAWLQIQPGSIAVAAEQAGYGSDVALSRAFKAATGVSPGQWRRERQTSGRNEPRQGKLAAMGLTRI
ncbi:AraC-like DNA-binding protein [Pseudomonas marginalis]|nr:AraC-like DNA-binding protein [Pseudomonas marginalis]MCP1523387.1 AraC-like DNA-binding protein [Pseudomonas marginalis]